MPRIDYPRIVRDLRAAGLTWRAIGKLLEIPHTTVRSWTDGCEPRHGAGEALLRLAREKNIDLYETSYQSAEKS